MTAMTRRRCRRPPEAGRLAQRPRRRTAGAAQDVSWPRSGLEGKRELQDGVLSPEVKHPRCRVDGQPDDRSVRWKVHLHRQPFPCCGGHIETVSHEMRMDRLAENEVEAVGIAWVKG